MADAEPWKVIKEDEARVQTIMYVALQIASALAVLSEPFLPFTSTKLKRILCHGQLFEASEWKTILEGKDGIPAGHKIGKQELLFAKIEDKEVQVQLDKLEASRKANETGNTKVDPQKEEIAWDDFTKLDIRVGTILEAEKMPKAKKLFVLKVDTGLDVRTIVSLSLIHI